ncbi:SEC-C motif-containing protein [Kitasatospora sp. MAP12-15]|uniref:YchJ family protein n=1 Tax=unclassified Kitasatospora TaxID=2633591 RepID=UPI0024751D82|nr:YchJ family metal-binding protein [Kitasatospora sp. MAP12-44]MDH6114936.1 SEC-C motif-containing protein [Kitasatospora sp. MAP12-44]
MSRRHTQPRPAAGTPTAPCPCGLPTPYEACCGRLHQGQPAATAEQLMRSRFTAFAVRDEAYLLRTWHPDTRPSHIDFDPGLSWQRLEVLAATDGGPFHIEGTVVFRAHYVDDGTPGTMQEHSRFVRVEGAWVYLDALLEG